MGQAYEQQGDYPRALDVLRKAEDFGSGNSKVISLRAYVLAKSGQTEQALAAVDKMQKLSEERYFPPYAIALVHAGMGDADLAFKLLEQALECHDVHLALLPADPKWDSFRSDVRFLRLLEGSGLPH